MALKPAPLEWDDLQSYLWPKKSIDDMQSLYKCDIIHVCIVKLQEDSIKISILSQLWLMEPIYKLLWSPLCMVITHGMLSWKGSELHCPMSSSCTIMVEPEMVMFAFLTFIPSYSPLICPHLTTYCQLPMPSSSTSPHHFPSPSMVLTILIYPLLSL